MSFLLLLRTGRDVVGISSTEGAVAVIECPQINDAMHVTLLVVKANKEIFIL